MKWLTMNLLRAIIALLKVLQLFATRFRRITCSGSPVSQGNDLMKKWYLIILLLAPSLAACGEYYSLPIDGKVVEERTLKPIPEAMVVIRWTGNISSSWVDSKTVCYHVETAITDKSGNFHIPGWTGKPANIQTDIYDLQTHIDAYKVGYGFPTTPPQGSKVVYLSPFAGTREERLEYLIGLTGMECGSFEEYRKKLIPLYKALYEEANSIAATEEDKKTIESILYNLEILELGFETAEKRHLARP